MVGARCPALRVLVGALLVACSDMDVPTLVVPEEHAVRPLPLTVPEPPDNPTTDAKVELGRMLFWDPILSGNRDVACATCHHPAHAYADGRDRSVGVDGRGLGADRKPGSHSQPIARNSMTVLDVAFNGVGATTATAAEEAPMFWDSRELSLETQALRPIESAEEMRGDAIGEEQIFPEVTARLSAIAEYTALFESAFGTPDVTRASIGRAIAAFERTLIARDSSFDRYMQGDESALSQAGKRGLVAFIESGCSRCHSGPMLSDFELHRIGVPTPAGQAPDLGDGTGRFRTPSLRNIMHTAPFMHDGSLATFEEIIEFYTAVDTSLDPNLEGLAPAGLDDMLALFEALSDGDFDRTVPERVPSGLPPGGHLE